MALKNSAKVLRDEYTKSAAVRESLCPLRPGFAFKYLMTFIAVSVTP